MTDNPTRILYVEDDPISARLVQRILVAEGFDVVEAADGITAIEVAQDTKPDLILMDINISGLTGYEVTTRLRSIDDLQHVPIVAVTAATMKGDRERALIAGCNGYIPKPIDVDRFPNQVRDFLAGRRERVSTPEEESEHLVSYSRQLVERLEEKIRELQDAHSDLQRLDKMKSDFVILAGHELRTPLTVMHGYSQLLLGNPDIPGTIEDEGSPRHLINHLAEATKRLNLVIEDILNVSLIDADRLELVKGPVFIRTLIMRAIEKITTSADAERELDFDVEGLENLPPIEGDSKQLHRALWNVISNAFKYTPDGGRVTIKGALVENAVHLYVKDTGIGLDPEERERIFDRFYVLEDTMLHRTSKTAFKGGGLGLGLTVARGIIEAHGGKIWAESAGRDEEKLPGSTFHILLPIPPGDPVEMVSETFKAQSD
jgi:signal transduction histidine kinase